MIGHHFSDFNSPHEPATQKEMVVYLHQEREKDAATIATKDAEIERLTAERDASHKRAENLADELAACDGFLQDQRCFTAKAEAERDAAREDAKRLRDALTPGGETKAAYMGEFTLDVEESDGMGGSINRDVTIPWTTIKEIMAAILKRAAAAPQENTR